MDDFDPVLERYGRTKKQLLRKLRRERDRTPRPPTARERDLVRMEAPTWCFKHEPKEKGGGWS